LTFVIATLFPTYPSHSTTKRIAIADPSIAWKIGRGAFIVEEHNRIIKIDQFIGLNLFSV
jgi:hypothetical protein